MTVITSNKTMETLTVIITQEADPVTITTKGEKTKTETETTTDKINIDKTTETKITATPNIDTTPTTKSHAEKMRHTRLTLTMKAMMDKTLTFQTKSHGNTSHNEFYFADEKFHDTNKTNDEKENDEPAEDADDTSMISYATADNEDTELTIGKKTYQDDLIPLLGELLNTETSEPTVTPIPKQEIDYHPKIVLVIPKDPQANRLTLL
jgi:hypothetical protein